jgi:hypothetical protein
MIKTNIYIYPKKDSQEEITDILNRVSWYFSELRNVQFKIISTIQKVSSIKSKLFPNSLNLEFNKIKDRVKFIKNLSQENISDQDIFILYNKKKINRFPKKYHAQTFTPDRERVTQESQQYISIINRIAAQEVNLNIIEHQSKLKFSIYYKKISSKRSSGIVNIFGTGPNLDKKPELDYNQGINIGCNSIIFNQDLLESIHLDILVFADPIFHFGPSLYASKFRTKLVEVMTENTDLCIFIPFKYYFFFTSKYPKLSDRIIGIPEYPFPEPNFDIKELFAVKITNNILTFLMIPLATTFGCKVNFFGFDGKSLENSNYFWSHNKNSQINEEMQSIKKTHPAFFNIDYNDYYLYHIEILTHYIDSAFKSGYIISNLTKSFIPCLIEISIDTNNLSNQIKELDLKKQTNSSSLFVGMIPNMRNFSGHHLSHEIAIKESVEINEKGTHLTLAHKDFKSAPETVSSLSIYDETIYGIRDSIQNNNENIDVKIRRIILETYWSIYLVQNKFSFNQVNVYHYTGYHKFIPYYAQLARALFDFNVNFMVNLFYCSSEVLNNRGIPNRFKSPLVLHNFKSVDMLEKILPIRFSVDNEKLKEAIFNLSGSNLDVWPHFSATILPEKSKEIPIEENSKTTLYYPSFLERSRGIKTIFKMHNKYIQKLEEKNIVPLYRSCDLSQNNKVTKAISKEVNFPNNNYLLKPSLSPEEYSNYFSESDIICIPYHKSHFRYRTSAILIDSINFNKPVIAVKDTWAGDMIEKLGIGEVYINESHDDLFSKIITIKENYSKYLQNCKNVDSSIFSTSHLIQVIISGALKRPYTFTSNDQYQEFFRFQNLHYIPLIPIKERSLLYRALRKVYRLIKSNFL